MVPNLLIIIGKFSYGFQKTRSNYENYHNMIQYKITLKK